MKPFVHCSFAQKKIHSVVSIASQFEHLQNLTLVDSSQDEIKCSNILAGVDYYYSSTGSGIKRGSGNHPLAISSIFGWILCGSKETQRNVHTDLNSSNLLPLNIENVINNCFDILNSM